jgi:hypothetical protein
LGHLEGARTAVDGGQRRGAARPVGNRRPGTGEREGEGKMAGKLPHHHVVLRGRSIDGERQRGGGAAAARGARAEAAAAGAAARVRPRGGGCG